MLVRADMFSRNRHKTRASATSDMANMGMAKYQ